MKSHSFNFPMFILAATCAGYTGWLARLNCPAVPLIVCALVVLLFAVMTLSPEDQA